MNMVFERRNPEAVKNPHLYLRLRGLLARVEFSTSGTFWQIEETGGWGKGRFAAATVVLSVPIIDSWREGDRRDPLPDLNIGFGGFGGPLLDFGQHPETYYLVTYVEIPGRWSDQEIFDALLKGCEKSACHEVRERFRVDGQIYRDPHDGL